jgi:DNA-binding MarR family transcriptional regulator
MSKPQSGRGKAAVHSAELIERLHMAGRELSTSTVMFHTALAQVRGLSASEEKALDVLLRLGPLTHTELRGHTGLAPASVSDLIDRLESKGYAHRSRHPEDRRSTVITADADRILTDVTPLFENWVAALEQLYAAYTTKQLEVICDFMTKAAAHQREAAAELGQP